ncbi:MAG: SPOR domain-containing protein [Candidatus Aminicenantes bacterium]
MRNKDYRELQISSSMLIFVFIAIIVLGIVIFLLGVSVGKKQASLTKQTQFADVPIEQVQEKKPAASEQPEQDKDKINQEIASHAKIKSKEQAQEAEKPSPVKQNLYYIQVGAYTDKSSASKIADKYNNMGFKSLVVSPLPTDRRTIYRVRIGGYETREEAEEIKEILMEKENKKSSDYFIIQGSV